MFSKLLLTALGLASTVVAHGIATGIVADGIYYDGYNPSYQYKTPAPVTVGWKTPSNLGNAFVPPASYNNGDIICHLSATNAMAAAPVKGGGKVEIQWTPWPVSHKGPVIDYLANCNGPCETADKTKLLWFKIDGVGLLSTKTTNGMWATDQLIANNNSWTVTIPPSIATGNYVLRHEIIALHAAQQSNGAQNYPQCYNLAVNSTGKDKPTGILGTQLYKAADPGIAFDLYASTLSTYAIPGPALYLGASNITLSQTLPPKPTATSTGVYTIRKV